MSGVIVRILLRYLAAAMVARGLISVDIGDTLSGDADIAAALELVVGLAVAAVTEGWYFLARRFGWST